jgi:hypothetical protein
LSGRYYSLFGDFARGVSGHACSVWDDKLYVIGGVANGEQSLIQICSPDKQPCRVSSDTLSVARFDGQAVTLGSSVMVMCGDSYSGSTDIIEVYDIVKDRLLRTSETNAPNLPDPAKSCCLINDLPNKRLFLSGGLTTATRSSVAGTLKDIISVSYAITELVEDDQGGDDAVKLWDCYKLRLTSEYEGFNGEYTIRSLINSHVVWTDDAFMRAIYFDSSLQNDCWIGNYEVNEWAYYEHGFSSGTWMVMTQQSTINVRFDFTCVDTKNTNESGGSNKIAGLAPAVFWTIIAVCLVIVATILIIVFMCRRNALKTDRKFKSPAYVKQSQSAQDSGFTPDVLFATSSAQKNGLEAVAADEEDSSGSDIHESEIKFGGGSTLH